MGKISTYTTKGVLTGNELVIGTDVDAANETKNFNLQDIADLAANNTPSFQQYRSDLLGPNFATINSSPAAPGVDYDVGNHITVDNSAGTNVAFVRISVHCWIIRQGASSGDLDASIRNYTAAQNIVQFMGSVASNIENIQDRWVPVTFTYDHVILAGVSQELGVRVTRFGEEFDITNPFISAQAIFFP